MTFNYSNSTICKVASIVVIALVTGGGCGDSEFSRPVGNVDNCPDDFVSFWAQSDDINAGSNCSLVVHNPMNCSGIASQKSIPVDCTAPNIKKFISGPYHARSHSPLVTQDPFTPTVKIQNSAAVQDAAGVNPVQQLLQRLLPLSFPLLSSGALSAPNPASTCNASANASFFAIEHDNASVVRLFPCNANQTVHVSTVSRPLELDITPDGSQLWVTSYDQGITIIDTHTNAVIATIKTDAGTFPSGIAITPDGTRAYVTSFIDVNPALVVYDTATLKEVARVPIPSQYPIGVFLTPDGSTAYVTNTITNAVYIVDTLSNTIINSRQVISPYGIGFSPDGTTAYIASGDPSIRVFDTKTLGQTGSYKVTGFPINVMVSPNGRWLITENHDAGTVSEINTVTGEVKVVKVGGNPHGIIFVN